MARLVIGTSKTSATAAIVRDVAPVYYIEKIKTANNTLSSSNAFIDLSGIERIGSYGLANTYCYSGISGTIDMSNIIEILSNGCYYTFQYSSSITNVDLRSLETVYSSGCAYMFYYCTGITSINLSLLKTIESSGCQRMFAGCSSLSTVDLSNLIDAKASGCNYMFQNCTNITTADVSSLVFCRGMWSIADMFNGCTKLENADFSSLKDISGSAVFSGTFSNCRLLQSLSFPALTESSFGTTRNQFNNGFGGVTGITLHFPPNIRTIIESLTGYPNFAGTSTVITYDLPASNHIIGANTTEYERNPKYDTSTALAWRVKDTGTTASSVIWTPYYTNGVNAPQVNDTIYSDSACTTTVTTISSIA